MSKGRFGVHGGQYIPETLMNAMLELEEAYKKYKDDPEFNWNQLGGLYQWFMDTYAHLSLAELKGKLCENIVASQTMIDSISEEELFQRT